VQLLKDWLDTLPELEVGAGGRLVRQWGWHPAAEPGALGGDVGDGAELKLEVPGVLQLLACLVGGAVVEDY
jgi:hypothetical protein